MAFDISRMISVPFFLNNRLEAMMLISYIVDNAFSTIGFIEPVLTFYLITVSRFPSLLMIMRVIIFYTIAILEFNCILRTTNKIDHIQHINLLFSSKDLAYSTYISISAMVIWIMYITAGMIGKCTTARCNQNSGNLYIFF